MLETVPIGLFIAPNNWSGRFGSNSGAAPRSEICRRPMGRAEMKKD
jgi:hypothetical protein